MEEGSNGSHTMSLPVWFYLNLIKTTGVSMRAGMVPGSVPPDGRIVFSRVRTCIAYGVHIHTDTCFGHWDSSICL